MNPAHLQVSPRLTMNNHRNIGLVNLVPCGQLSLTHFAARVDGSNFSYLAFSQFRGYPGFCSSLLVAVTRVVGVGSKPQMGRINARRIIAAMKNPQPFGDRAIVQIPRKAVGAAHGLEAAIAVPVSAASPLPALFRLSNFIPKALIGRRLSASIRTIHLRLSAIRMLSWAKRSTASLAGLCYFSLSQGVNLRDRFTIWLGPCARRNLAYGPLCILAQEPL